MRVCIQKVYGKSVTYVPRHLCFIMALLFLLILCIYMSQPNLAHRPSETSPEAKHPKNPSNSMVQHILDEVLRGQIAKRLKRHVSDFSMDTPAPKSNASSSSGTNSESGGASSGTAGGDGSSGQGLVSWLGNLLGSSGSTDNSSTSDTTGGGASLLGEGGGESNGLGDLFETSVTSSSAPIMTVQDSTQEGEPANGMTSDLGDLLASLDNSATPQEGILRGDTSSELPDLGGELGDIEGLVGHGNTRTVNSSESSQGRGLGDIPGGLLYPSDPVDPSDAEGDISSSCVNVNMCDFGYTCKNGGTCFYNTTSCVVRCLCPPPYDNPQLYDQRWCTPLATTVPVSFSPSTSNTTTTSGDVTGVTCSGMNICHHRYTCDNGGTCHYNLTSCSVRCRCPPPYDDPHLYDQRSCRLLSTPTPYHTSTSSSYSTSTETSPGPSTTLRPLHERRCRGVTCLHGFCNATARSPCRCDPGWYGLFCDRSCSRKCSNGGVCKYDTTTRRERCVCHFLWKGYNCTELDPEPPGEDKALVYWLSGSFVVGVVAMVTLSALFMFYLWRKRLVFALKVVYYFLPYEDNDGRRYDAFVSYVLEDKDKTFVHTNLRSKLEDEIGFNLCLHQRDFPAGGVISDTILDALEDSRRFILILTPSYLTNEWAEFEFQRAFQEMLKRKLRIIPIILEDITTSSYDTLNPTLKTILESVTLLKYPGSTADERKLRKFWKQVRLCMPKRKKSEDSAMIETPTRNDAVVRPIENFNTNNNKICGSELTTRTPTEINVAKCCSNICDVDCENEDVPVDYTNYSSYDYLVSHIGVENYSVREQTV